MNLVWFRNDLRTGDHSALYQACQCSTGEGVIAVALISIEQWLKQDESKARVQFWLASLHDLKEKLQQLNIPLKILKVPNNSNAPSALLELASKYQVNAFYFNREYPLYEQRRDSAVTEVLTKNGIKVMQYDCDAILMPGEVLNQKGEAYKVFTPFAKAWRQHHSRVYPTPLPEPEKQPASQISSDSVPEMIEYPSISGADWHPSLWPAGTDNAHQRLFMFIESRFVGYREKRDLPAILGTSSLSPYLSVGVLSARQCLAAAEVYSRSPDWLNSQWVTELIWRDFYRHLLVLFPEMNQLRPFKPEVEERIKWRYDSAQFKAWCDGETGFAIVDAGMKQLLETGWMHNRVRMICASFLTKLLRHDWRYGAQFFMQHLIDGDFASNLGGWQWSASVGADAAPYFRIFNPMRQAERFDAEGDYISGWLPELSGFNAQQQHQPAISIQAGRPAPIIDYKLEREKSITGYNSGIKMP